MIYYSITPPNLGEIFISNFVIVTSCIYNSLNRSKRTCYENLLPSFAICFDICKTTWIPKQTNFLRDDYSENIYLLVLYNWLYWYFHGGRRYYLVFQRISHPVAHKIPLDNSFQPLSLHILLRRLRAEYLEMWINTEK